MEMPNGPGLSPAAATWPVRPPGRRPRHTPADEPVIVGAHGGAGVTTLAGLLRPAWDMGVVRRPGQGHASLPLTGQPVLLVTRNSVTAEGRAVSASRLLAEQGGAFPEQRDELEIYLDSFRSVAGADGHLPGDVDLVIEDVFSDLIERAR